MSLATTCPNCSTCFRVVQDQLRVSEGWVRCGHCQQVFNALQSLFDLDAPQEPVALPLPSTEAHPPSRGFWQTEATARWKRRNAGAPDAAAEPAPFSESPSEPNAANASPAAPRFAPLPAADDAAAPAWGHGEREEPLSDDWLAALHAETAPHASLDEYAPDDHGDPSDNTAPAHYRAAPELPLDLPTAVEPPPGAHTPDLPAVEGDVEGDVEPAPIDESSSNETAFAPFVATEDRREPVFELTRYEPHGFDAGELAGSDPPQAAPSAYTLPAEGEGPAQDRLPEASGDAQASFAPEEGPPSAAMFLSEPEPEPAVAAAAANTAEVGLPVERLAPAEPEVLAAASTPSTEEAATALPSFLTAAERRERWDSPATRWTFASAAILMIAALALQVAWHWRDRLAMAWPVTATPLSAVCQLAGCTLGAPRELNALAVDNTALARPPGSTGYKLTVQLHNTAAHPIAAPSFDLVLTDAQGVVVARRTLEPADFDFHGAELPANADLQWTSEFTLAEGSLVGYTVAAFYP